MKTLTPKQERFCLEYVKDLNATQAAIRAGYAPNAAQEQSSRLLSKAIVKARVNQLKSDQAKRIQIDSDVILRELLALATVDVTEAFDDMGGLKPFKEMPEAVRKSLAGLEVTELFSGQGDQKTAIGLLKKIKFWDKPRALEMLGKHLKLFTERHEHSGPDGKPIETLSKSDLSDEELNARISAFQAKSGREEG